MSVRQSWSCAITPHAPTTAGRSIERPTSAELALRDAADTVAHARTITFRTAFSSVSTARLRARAGLLPENMHLAAACLSETPGTGQEIGKYSNRDSAKRNGDHAPAMRIGDTENDEVPYCFCVTGGRRSSGSSPISRRRYDHATKGPNHRSLPCRSGTGGATRV